MTTYHTLFQAKVEGLLSATPKRSAFFFRGFLPAQLEYLVHHPSSLYDSEELLAGGSLRVEVLERDKRELLKRLTLAEAHVVGLYEELIALSGAVRDLSLVFDGEIVVVNNPLFTSSVPCCLSQSQASALFDSLQADRMPKDPELEVLSRYYGDVLFLDRTHILLSPANVHQDTPYGWVELTGTQAADGPAPGGTEIVEGSTEDWLCRFAVMEGDPEPVVYCVEQTRDRGLSGGLGAVLNALGVPFARRVVDTRLPEMEYEAGQFEKQLKRYWGEKASFRELLFYKQPSISKETVALSQGALVSEIIDQCEAAQDEDCAYRDIFITAPTGAGKSLLFQLPALYLAERYGLVTLVITPLVALMHDQVAQLERERGVRNATFLNSKITFEERQRRIEGIHRGDTSILYLAPELLLSSGIRPIVGERKVGLLVIDEVHTVTSWGRDFRPDYCFLGDFLKTIKRTGQKFPILCLTATAVYSGNEDVVNDTIAELDLHNPILHLGNVKRENISFAIQPGQTGDDNRRIETLKQERIIQQLAAYIARGEKTLVYCPYRSQVDAIYTALPTQVKPKVRRYHGKVGDTERKLTERDYSSGAALALICTKAFGMGVDVPDIRHIIHFAPSGNLSDYVQEVGRAARDPAIQGCAHMDFFPSDMRYVKSLNGISEMRQYQLQEMLKKLYAIYSVKQHRNLLIAPDSFAYLFAEGELETRVKSGFLLLAKDLKNKYAIPILVVRPKAMLTKNYVNVPPEIEADFLARFGAYATLLGKVNDRIIASRNPALGSDVVVKNLGRIYAVKMGELWENEFADMTFGSFKYLFFQGELLRNKKGVRLSPRIRVEVQYKTAFETAAQTVTALMDALVRILSQIRSSEKKTFEEAALYRRLREALPELELSATQLSLILDMLTLNVDENAPYTESRNSVRVLKKRKQKGADTAEYLIGNHYSGVKDYLLKYLYQCVPDPSGLYHSFVPMGQENAISVLPVLKLLQILDLASYELRGGEKAEIFVRINDPEKIRYLANTNYRNNVLREVVRRHKLSQELLCRFFTQDLDNGTRWELIEDYFLGREEEVYALLGMPPQ